MTLLLLLTFPLLIANSAVGCCCFSAAGVSAVAGVPTVDSVPAGFDVCDVPVVLLLLLSTLLLLMFLPPSAPGISLLLMAFLLHVVDVQFVHCVCSLIILAHPLLPSIPPLHYKFSVLN